MTSPAELAAQSGFVAKLVARLVGLGAGRPRLVALAALAAFVASLAYLAANLSIRTDLNGLIDKSVPWRRTTMAIEQAFPQMGDDIVVVIDGQTPERAHRAATALTTALQARTDLFSQVDPTDAFLDREGLLFLGLPEVKAQTQALIAAQPLLGPVAADPSLRGLADGLRAALTGAEQDPQRLTLLGPPLARITAALDSAARGKPVAFSWQALLSGGAADRGDLRRIVRLTPVVDYSKVAPGERAEAAIRRTAKDLGLNPASGVTVRLTGSVPMADDELATLGEAIGPIAALSLAGVAAVLMLATRSWRMISAIAATVLVGLGMTSALGLAIYGAFNVISVAFLPLFVGLGVDFAVQFAMRYRVVSQDAPSVAAALVQSGQSIGRSIALAAAAAAIGFLSFLPTAYKGVSELGGIAGLGMIVSFLLTLTLLPALIGLLGARPPPPRTAAVGRPPSALTLAAMGAAALAGAATLGLLRFDFDPLSLRNPATQSVATYHDLAGRPETTPNTLDIQRPDLRSATQLADRLARLPQVAHAYTLRNLVPADQAPKLAAIGDAALLLDSTLSPFEVAAPPDDAAIVASLDALAARLREVAAAPGQPGGPAKSARQAAAVLESLARAPAAGRARAQAAVLRDLPEALDEIRMALAAQPVTLDTLPPALKQQWVAPSGVARIEVWPSGDPTRAAAIQRFVAAVRGLAADVSGVPVIVRDVGATVLTAFLQAAGLSVLAIAILLFAAMRSAVGVALTLAPVVLTLLLTLATTAALRQAINLENIIALPLVLGIGVSFNVYLVSAWRSGAPAPLRANLARAILYSALTTGAAFGALVLSSHPGTASLGLVLTVALGWTIVTTLVFQPALLAWKPVGRLL
ncbi:MAG TPA: MMPL family transporter [Phenylobacterium sp.]|uniref:MMPL family transporter n=1 Tax=Phenylobacterium sp. TaxID=1871053 RepID=UPI002BFF38A1|nr:MMPL family transporter [Phenylobacterium sp.]HXA40223.1 MMPL family transporter [Phenylobacterium sp.]